MNDGCDTEEAGGHIELDCDIDQKVFKLSHINALGSFRNDT